MSPEQLQAWHRLGLGPVWKQINPPAPQGSDLAVPAALSVRASSPVPLIQEERPELAWQRLAREVSACEACELSKTRQHPVLGSGSLDARCLLIGEAPGAEEDRQGVPFVGRAGALLDQMLLAVGLDRERDVYVANTLKCRPPANRNPEPVETDRCRPFLLRQLELLQPGLIVLMGRFAAQSLLGTDSPISTLRGRLHQAQLGVSQWPCIVTYHPAYLLRNPADKGKAWRDWLSIRQELRGRGLISASPRQ